jgi:para-nitrobenzyl esterase
MMIARTTAGDVAGTVTAEGIVVFKGIPYARADRFEAPRAADGWSGVREALGFGPRCPQRRDPADPSLVDEQCHVLNVWTPALRDGKSRPVMVWFHGGGFSSSSGSLPIYDGTRLAARGDVVVVTLNHRLNVFGFLNVNAGMLDLIAALEWVRANARELGGDPGCVTIFGQSGGGAKVCTLLGMPAARGLFHRAIVQSGAHPRALDAGVARAAADQFVTALGGDPRTATVERLVATLEHAKVGPFSPVVDGHHLHADPMLAPVPVLLSTTRTETTFQGIRDPSLFELDRAGLHRALGTWVDSIGTLADDYARLDPHASPSELYFRITSDIYARVPSWILAERATGPVYSCELAWSLPGRLQSPHELDVPLVLDTVERPGSLVPPGDDARRMTDQLCTAWLAFARTGDPNHPGLPAWPRYTADRATLVFDLESRIELDRHGAARQILASVPLKPLRR